MKNQKELLKTLRVKLDDYLEKTNNQIFFNKCKLFFDQVDQKRELWIDILSKNDEQELLFDDVLEYVFDGKKGKFGNVLREQFSVFKDSFDHGTIIGYYENFVDIDDYDFFINCELYNINIYIPIFAKYVDTLKVECAKDTSKVSKKTKHTISNLTLEAVNHSIIETLDTLHRSVRGRIPAESEIKAINVLLKEMSNLPLSSNDDDELQERFIMGFEALNNGDFLFLDTPLLEIKKEIEKLLDITTKINEISLTKKISNNDKRQIGVWLEGITNIYNNSLLSLTDADLEFREDFYEDMDDDDDIDDDDDMDYIDDDDMTEFWENLGDDGDATSVLEEILGGSPEVLLRQGVVMSSLAEFLDSDPLIVTRKKIEEVILGHLEPYIVDMLNDLNITDEEDRKSISEALNKPTSNNFGKEIKGKVINLSKFKNKDLN